MPKQIENLAPSDATAFRTAMASYGYLPDATPFRFACAPAATAESLAHNARIVGRAYAVSAWNEAGKGAAMWVAIAAQGAPPQVIGAVSFDSASGRIILQGLYVKLALAWTGTLDPCQIGAGTDQTAAGQAGIWDVARAFCEATGAVLRPAMGKVTAANVTLDKVRFIHGQGAEFTEVPAGFAGPLVTLDMTGYKISDVRESWLSATGINVGPNTSLGQYDFQGTQSLATGFVLNADNGGNSARRFHANRLATGLVVKGNTEKNIYQVHATFCAVAVRGDTSAGSADTLHLQISGTNNKQVFLPDDGDTSFMITLNTEGRIDDGSSVGCHWDGGATQRPTAYIELRNGKHVKLAGRHRGHNGRVLATDDRAYEKGTDTVLFDLETIHTYGTLYSSYRIQHIRGTWAAKDCMNGRPNFAATDSTGGSIPCAAFHLRQVWDAADFTIDVTSCRTREAVRWGDAALGLYSRGAHMGHYRGNMDNLDSSAFDPGLGKYPVNQTFLHIEKAERCFATMEVFGNIKAEAGSIDNRIAMPGGADWVRQGFRATAGDGSVLPAGRLFLELGGSIARDEIIWRPWSFDGLSANIDEFGGRSDLRSGAWSMPQAPTVTLAQLQSATHWVNSKVKRAGAQVFHNGKPLYATGSGATDSWSDAAGTAVVTSIGEIAATGAFATRVTAAGSALTGATRAIYDRLFFDLDEAGIMAKLALLYIFGTQDEATAKLNLRSGLVAGPYDAVPVAGPGFTAFAGYIGDGSAAYLSTGYNPSAQAEGMGLANMHIGLVSLATGAGTVDAGSRSNNRLRIGSLDDGLTYSTSNSAVLNIAGIGGPPQHVVATRGASPVGGRAYRNGILVGAADGLDPSTLMPTDIDVLRQGSAYSAERVVAFHVGTNLNDGEVQTLYRAIRKALMQLGAWS